MPWKDSVCSNRWILQPEILHFIVLHGQSPSFIMIRKTARGSWWAAILFFFFLNKKTASVQPQCEELYWTQRTTLRSQPGIQASQHVLFCLSSLLLFFGAECFNFLLLVPASPRSSETGKPAAVQFSFLHWTSYLPYMLPRNRETLVKSRVMQGKAVQTSRRVSQSSPNI